MKILFFILPFLAGIAITVQAGINSQLRMAINNPVMAALISFLVGTVTLGILLLLSKPAVPGLAVYSTVSWYKFTGGLLGVFMVMVALLSVREIGAANMAVLIIAGQLLMAVVMDHFGMLGLRQSPVTLQKVIGIFMLVVGVYLVNRK